VNTDHTSAPDTEPAPRSTRRKDLENPACYPAEPGLNCDLVMKGGITSGVTYPWAVCEIATTYRLRSVGGSSAGAIAAAAAAAAEKGRAVSGGGFARLARLPERLAATFPETGESVLFGLFQPQPRTKPFYRLLRAGLQAKGSRLGKVGAVLKSLLMSFPVAALAASLPGLAVVAFLVTIDTKHPEVRASGFDVAGLIVGIIAGLFLAVAGAIGGAGVSGVRRALRDIAGNRFGLCSGYLPAPDSDLNCGQETERDGTCSDDTYRSVDGRCLAKPLTMWLADELDGLAGITDPSRPLTLGNLCSAGVNLKMYTTNLTDGTPYTIPFKSSAKFYFDPADFAELFPERVVCWMRDHPGAAEHDMPAFPCDHEGKERVLLPLPDCEQFPVVVATRLSLSFPLLLSAIPLWTIDHIGGRWVPCLFSDGGITSNFPIHFFDGPIPRWPTFGLNLGPFGADERPDERECNNIWSPMNNREGIFPRWTAITSLVRFGHAIADTMQNWSDNVQTRVPGYRDRIVLIKHTQEEGGMNLNMPPERILSFSERGRCAGELLVRRFSRPAGSDPDDELSWENHRWLRYRSYMPLLETHLEKFRRAYAFPPGKDLRTYEELIVAKDPRGAEDRRGYPWCAHDQRMAAEGLTDRLLGLANEWLHVPPGQDPSEEPCQCEAPDDRKFDPTHPFRCRAPRPRPTLRVTPDA
jgi:hypothetical protein